MWLLRVRKGRQEISANLDIFENTQSVKAIKYYKFSKIRRCRQFSRRSISGDSVTIETYLTTFSGNTKPWFYRPGTLNYAVEYRICIRTEFLRFAHGINWKKNIDFALFIVTLCIFRDIQLFGVQGVSSSNQVFRFKLKKKKNNNCVPRKHFYLYRGCSIFVCCYFFICKKLFTYYVLFSQSTIRFRFVSLIQFVIWKGL